MDWRNLDGIPPVVYNQNFLQKLGQDAGQVTRVGDNFVADRLREDMVFNTIVPQKPIRPEECQVNLENDTMYYIVNLDTNAAAAITDFRGPGRGQIIRAPRVPMSFHMLKSREFEIAEQELLVYNYPIMQMVYDYAIKAIGDQHDLYMLQNVKRAVDFVDANAAYKAVFGGGRVFGVSATGGPLTAGIINPLNSLSLTRGKQNQSNRIKPSKVLITQFDHNTLDSLQALEQGDQLRGQVFREGYREPMWTGVATVVTTKQDVFKPGNLWLFADEKFLGKNGVLDYGGAPYKLFIDRRSNIVTFHVYSNFGAVIANVGSAVQLKMYDAAYEAANPKQNPLNIVDDDLFQQRNLAEQGGRFPQVRSF